MKLSEVREEQLLAMTPEQKWNFICGEICDKGESAEYAILLGSKPCWSGPRARAAAKVYLEGALST